MSDRKTRPAVTFHDVLLTLGAFLASVLVASTASAHYFYYSLYSSNTHDAPLLVSTLRTLAGNHVDIDVIATTPAREWIIVAGADIYHSQGFPSAPLNKIQQFIGLGRNIDAVAFTPDGDWMVVAENLFWHSGSIANGTSLYDKVREWIISGHRVTDLVFDADNQGWSVVAGGLAWTWAMPEDFLGAVLERHPGKRRIGQMAMGFDRDWAVVADQWLASDRLDDTLLNRLRRFQRAGIRNDRLLVGRDGDYVLYSHGHVEPDLTDPMERVEYALGADGKNIWQRMWEDSIPGVSIAVVDDNRVAWARGYGTLEAGTQRWVRSSSPFDAASCSKFLGAMAAMTAVEEYPLLDLDADIADYMYQGTDLASWASTVDLPEGVTLKRLLSHSASLEPHSTTAFSLSSVIPGTFELLMGAWWCRSTNDCDRESSRRVRPDGTTPGTAYNYSGGGFLAAEAVIEAYAGDSFDQRLRDYVFTPIGMENALLANPLSAAERARAATPHNSDGTTRGHLSYPWTAGGGVFATPSDIAKATVVLLNQGVAGNGQRILSESGVLTTLTDHAPGSDRYGLGVGLSNTLVGEAGGSFRHSGYHPGARAYFEGGPARDQAFVIMANGDQAQGLVAEIKDALRCAYGWSSPSSC